jgi:quinol monooxygenase YgiN
MSKVIVLAKIPVQDGKRADVVAGMAPMMDHVEAEAGTLEYILCEDAGDENAVWMYEVYADQAAFEAHSGSDVMKSLGGAIGPLLAGRPELTFLSPVRGKGL